MGQLLGSQGPSLVLPAVTEVPAESGAKAGVHVGCWGCPRGALGEGERGPLMVAPPGRRASEGEAGGTILCLLSHQGLLQGDAAAKSFQSCLTLCDPIDGLLPGSPGILQERTLEWAAISFSNA